MRADAGTATPGRRGGRRKGSGKRADASAPWPLRAIQALADGSRWSIVQYVSEHEATVGTIARGLSLSVACTSKHLSILREAGLIEIRRQGRESICRLVPGDSDGADLLRALGVRLGASGGSAMAAPGEEWPRNDRLAAAAPELESSRVRVIKRYKSNDLEDFLL
jgi:DNA-binding transcriptional ArsR family regulator